MPQKGQRIFISYRRADSAGYAGRIYDRLTAHFGKDAVFMDVTAIDAGLDFVEVLQNAVQSCDVLVALIDRNWLDIIDEAGKRRLDNPEDFVRVEIAAALSRKIRVIPVLMNGVTMPQSTELPDDLKPFVRRNALQVDHHSFDSDSKRLISQLELALKAAKESKMTKKLPPIPLSRLIGVGGVIILTFGILIFGGMAIYRFISPSPEPTPVRTLTIEPTNPPVQEPTETTIPLGTPTLTHLPTATKIPSKTPVPLLAPIAGTWIGVDKGTVGGNPVPDRDVELIIKANCNLGDDCGTRTVHVDDSICGGTLILIDVQDDIYSFDTDPNEGSASFCGEGGIIIMTLLPDNMLLSESDGYNSSGSRVIKNGTFSHP